MKDFCKNNIPLLMVWKKVKEWEFFPFVLLGFMMLIMHILMKGGWGDDVDFSKVDNNLVSYLKDRYFTWSSRIIIELSFVFFSKINFLIWGIFNTIIYTLIGVMLSKLLVKSNYKEMNYFIAGMMIIYPFYHMATAGWITTCASYLYPLFCFIYCLLTIKKIFESKKILWYEHLFYAAALLYASSMEQVALIMTILFAFLVVYNYRHIVGISLIVSIAQIINAVICPGNKIRALEEIHHLPSFAEFTLFDKLNIGFYSTMINFLTSFDAVFLIFTSMLFLTITFKYQNYKPRFIAIIPLLIWLISMPIRALSKIGYIKSIPSETLWLSIALLIIFLVILYSVIRAFDKSEIMAVLFVLATGFISRVLMGFSPTVYASSYRTFIYMYFSIIICLIILLNKQLPQLMEKKIFIHLFIFICAFSYMLNLFKAIRNY
jgi:hypothetical protein